MLLSFEKCLQSKSKSAISCPLFDKSSKIETLVCQAPVFDFFPLSNFNLSKSISPNCLGEAILNSSLVIEKIFFSNSIIFLVNVSESEFNVFSFTIIPSFSMSDKTDINSRSNY